ncbi:MAG: zinc dependent phospholipase C family protein [Dehalococcoidia bacterium]
MPNLPKHIHLAKLSSTKINLHIISKNIGYFLLGSTSPDMHVISKENREQYHFSTLSVNKIGTGIENILIKYPELKNIRDQNSETQAFFAGYISHLIADEMWINKIFRPYFGNKSIYNDEILGLLMDRAVQLDMDKQAWPVLNNSLIYIRNASKSLNIKFINNNKLTEWREWITNFLSKDFSWERLKFMAKRIEKNNSNKSVNLMADSFLESIDSNLEKIYSKVSKNEIIKYEKDTIDITTKLIGTLMP